ncbi:MAG TPA: hypothetical protein VKQ11_13815 [Candidatus Sulfotelmatobacter sp.]|nr:hypothetical protein [Candidatus Sulfotelmatobacter sp.]
MREAIYNLAIPESIAKSANRGWRSALAISPARFVLLFLVCGPAISASAADWSVPEQELARKIVAVTGPGAAAVTIENRSSLGRRNSEIVQNGLRAALEQVGVRLVPSEQAAAAITISLSENPGSYVWVAQIQQGQADPAIVMVSVARSGGTPPVHDAMPMSLRKTLLFSQDTPILDVAVLQEDAAPTRIATLDADRVSIYRVQGGKWQQEQSTEITHAKPWPRDLRGRLVPAKDHLLDVYLPGVSCHSATGAPLALNCRETDDPWPIVAAGLAGASSLLGAGSENHAAIPAIAAFFSPARNFFTGALTPAVGKFTNVPKFYSAAVLPREKYALWFFSAIDGFIHMVDGMNDQAARIDWGSSIASIKTPCGAGWQLLTTSSGDRSSDSVLAYEFPDRDPVPVSAPIELPGTVTALWTEPRGDSVTAVVRDQETGDYEAFRLAMACSQ